jgi:UPF0176 protein
MLGPDKQPVLPTQIVQAGEKYYRLFPEYLEPDVSTDIQILHEDTGFVVVNKPAPLPMHASGRYHRNTLEHLLNLTYAPEKLRPAHRLDANTTGVVVFSRSRRWARLIQPQFEFGQVEKTYLARIQGEPTEDHFSCDKQISDEAGWAGIRFVDQDGVSAYTEFSVSETLRQWRNATGSSTPDRPYSSDPPAPLAPGLQHRRRPHLPGRSRGGQKQTVDTDAPPMCLHASKLSFLHPVSNERISFHAPDPEWVK